jgi:hypothetical protein
MGPKSPKIRGDLLERAENIRAGAPATHDTEARAELLLIASPYEKLADRLLATQQKLSGSSAPEESPE